MSKFVARRGLAIATSDLKYVVVDVAPSMGVKFPNEIPSDEYVRSFLSRHIYVYAR